MARWGKPRCSVCGLTLNEHPDMPCKKGITVQLLNEQLAIEDAKERAERRKLRLAQLNTRQSAKRSKSASKSRSRKKMQKRLTGTTKKGRISKQAQKRAQIKSCGKKPVYNSGAKK